MVESDFQSRLRRAQLVLSITDDQSRKEYLTGYMRGLRRAYHGEAFGTEDEHCRWLNLGDDPGREDLGRGYRDGIAERELLV